MAEAYRIIKWWQRHTNYEQRRSGGTWIVCPTQFDSLGYRLLMQTPKGVQAFGIYVPLAELAGRLPTAASADTAGILANEQGPLDADSIALMISAPVKVIGAALDLLMEPKIGWIERVPTPTIIRNPSGHDPDTDRNGSGSGPSHAQARPPAAAAGSHPSIQGGAGGILVRAGVSAARVPVVLSKLPDLTAAQVVALWADVKRDPKVRKIGSVLVTRLDQDGISGIPKLTLEAIREAIGAGLVESVNGIEVNGHKLTWNTGGVYLNGAMAVSASEVGKAVLS